MTRVLFWLALYIFAAIIGLVWDATKSPIICVSLSSNWRLSSTMRLWEKDGEQCTYMGDEGWMGWLHPEEWKQ